ncbi:hypothetical protein [Ktedonosporobacter rubrisoli]|uniref:hypothetical protein n=1 Tax=Ktedonosporobacter rubrisoli TaxID=2509675 RepID=UPI0013EEAB3D|nr:hypothetical protein [Ktedonosporobacter rubrisoli]
MQALQESRLAYKREIENDVEKQRRDSLEPFETRQETVESALKVLNRERKDVAAEMVHAFETLHHSYRQLTPHALELLEGLRSALEQLHVSAHEAWMIGDDLVRLLYRAQGVGIFAVWYDPAQRGIPDAICPDWIIHDFLEVCDALNL